MDVNTLVAGTDEAGRGALAGPVYAAAVILHPDHPIQGLNDSKLLSAVKREKLCKEIEEKSLAWAVAYADVEEIDHINILQASLLAMQRAVMKLSVVPSLVLVDGREKPVLSYPVRAIIGGDRLEPAISAASILAKVYRDREMCLLDLKYPQYGFAIHKGYGTEKHMESLREQGVSLVHRRSYAPVRALLESV